jgi:hypothetical protein
MKYHQLQFQSACTSCCLRDDRTVHVPVRISRLQVLKREGTTSIKTKKCHQILNVRVNYDGEAEEQNPNGVSCQYIQQLEPTGRTRPLD